MKLTLWVLLCVMSAPAFAVEADEDRKLVKIRASEIDKYPVLGILDFAEQRVSFDLGEEFVGGKIRAVVRLRNSGDTPVQIDKIKTSRGCSTTLRASDDPIAPGTEERLIVTVDTIRPGEYGVTVSVYHDDEMTHRAIANWTRTITGIAMLAETARCGGPS